MRFPRHFICDCLSIQVRPRINAVLEADIKIVIEAIVQKLPDLLRADLMSRDPAVRKSAEEVVATKIALAVADVFRTT